ncbi:hypothetical protein M0802_015418 [Mischocyttarus mexicanus]|nr:hypothetical protein M0802_015418 [Mischocyttarus mexicanus]
MGTVCFRCSDEACLTSKYRLLEGSKESGKEGSGDSSMASRIHRYGWGNGRECLLRSICELAEVPLFRKRKRGKGFGGLAEEEEENEGGDRDGDGMKGRETARAFF